MRLLNPLLYFEAAGGEEGIAIPVDPLQYNEVFPFIVACIKMHWLCIHIGQPE
jgi:hypothetical protein